MLEAQVCDGRWENDNGSAMCKTEVDEEQKEGKRERFKGRERGSL